jgi:hypothetical protein
MAVQLMVKRPRGPRGPQRELKTKRPGIIEAAKRILRTSPYAMTVRQVYYQMVVEHVVENIKQEYKRVGEALTEARKNGDLPYSWIVDRTRTYAPPEHGSGSPEEYLARIVRSAATYRADPWDGQDRLVLGVCEKDAMTAVLNTLAGELTDTFPRMWFTAARGYSSLTLVHTLAEGLQAEAQTRPVTLLYFGDFDPSGESMCASPSTMHKRGEPGDLVKRLRQQGCAEIETVKVALTNDQFEQWFVADGQDRLPWDPNPIKDTDSRFEWFQRLYGDHGAELDAVPIDRLRGLLVDHLSRLVDRGAYQQVLARQERRRTRLGQVLATLTLPPATDDDAGR